MIDEGAGRRTHAGLKATLLLVLAGLLASCAGTTRIGTILDDPGRYDGRDVRVRGEVTGSIGIPRVGGGYRIDDGTGTLTVVTEGRGTPSNGAEVEVEGTFRSAFTFGDRSAAVLVEKERYLP